MINHCLLSSVHMDLCLILRLRKDASFIQPNLQLTGVVRSTGCGIRSMIPTMSHRPQLLLSLPSPHPTLVSRVHYVHPSSGARTLPSPHLQAIYPPKRGPSIPLP